MNDTKFQNIDDPNPLLHVGVYRFNRLESLSSCNHIVLSMGCDRIKGFVLTLVIDAILLLKIGKITINNARDRVIALFL